MLSSHHLRPCLVSRRSYTLQVPSLLAPHSPLVIDTIPDLLISSSDNSCTSSPMSSRDHLLAAMSHPIISGVDAEDEVEAEAYMRSGLMALQLMSTPPTREGTPDGKRRKKVAWAGDEEEEVVVVEKEVEKVEEQKVLVDDCIDEDGHVWLLHLRERARDAIRSGVRKEDMALFSVHLTYSPSEYDRTPLDPPTKEERACCLPDRNSRVCADAYDALTRRAADIEAGLGMPEEESWDRDSRDEGSSWDAGIAMEEEHLQEVEVEEEQVEQKASVTQDDEDEWEAWLDQRKSAKAAAQVGCSLAAAAELVDAISSVPAPRRTGYPLAVRHTADEDMSSDTPSLASTASGESSSDHSHGLQQAPFEFTSGISMGSSPSGDAFLESWLPYSSSYCRREDDEGLETPGTESDTTLKPSKSGKKYRRGQRSTTFKGAGFGEGFGSSEFEGCLGGF